MQETITLTKEINIPLREGGATETVGPIPHRQLSERADKRLVDLLVKTINKLDSIRVATRGGFVGRPYFGQNAPGWNAHIHHYEDGDHQDGSMHIEMPQYISVEIEQAGWGERHPAYPDMLLVYSPRNEAEVEVIAQLVKLSYEFAVS